MLQQRSAGLTMRLLGRPLQIPTASSVCESEWGRDNDNFYNCTICVNTCLTSEMSLSLSLSLPTQPSLPRSAGARRRPWWGYQVVDGACSAEGERGLVCMYVGRKKTKDDSDIHMEIDTYQHTYLLLIA